ncbi:hypothetical protein B7494_g5162 [Chlorociboria aeruginascens]|nr:hypothetical protein B7494_g5162 [Chlorociboria aeruginascens]
MGLIDVRELLAFPQGDNSSDTLIAGIHFNLTTLKHWNYTYYSNNTFSNGSLCFLLFEPYTPHLLMNGTFLNSTSCYSPIDPIGTRSEIGLLYACLFALSIMFTFINLRKHGRLFLPTEKRFRAVGRRWQWYWMLMTAAFAIISGITGVDIDRYYLPELPIVLSNFFWFLMLPTTMATNFFMVVPRSWSNIEKQRDPDQARLLAEPTATDIRFKLAAFLLFGGWLTTVYSLRHSIKHYRPQNRGLFNRFGGFLRYTPIKFLLTLPLSLVMIGYEAACAFDFTISPLKLGTDLGLMYGLGWGAIAAIFLVYEVAGYIDPNEDRELIRQRRIRGAEIDQEMGITKKPHWWSRLNGQRGDMSVHNRIAENVHELGGGRATTKNLERSIEMGNMPISKRRDSSKPMNDQEALRAAANLLFPSPSGINEQSDSFQDTPTRGRTPGPNTDATTTRANLGDRSDSTNSTNSGVSITAKPQQVRSMLDV